jgi:uncharacterized protein YhaN
MRIRRLDLLAFGPFTDVSLDFSGGAPGGLHVVYGPNEAGKSSARRALRDLLFGFEARTPDNHVHAYDALRVGAELELGEGTLYVERRKARKGSLRDARGEILDEGVLERVLRGLDRAGYTRTFGLGHEELAAGGEEMLRGEASIGETLFDAGAGGPGVKRVREALAEEEERLYRPKGRLQELNVLLERHAEAKRRCQDAVLLPESHREQRDKLEAARAELVAVSTRLEALRAEQHRVRGLVHALPGLARRSSCLVELESLGNVPDLPEGSRERREKAQALEVEARAGAAKLTDEIERAKRRLSEIEVPHALLALGVARVDALANGIGRTRKAREDLPRIEGQKQKLAAEMAERLRRLGREGADSRALRVMPADSARIQKLATEHATLAERLAGAEQRASATARELSEQNKRLQRTSPVHDVEALARVASLARSLGDVEGPLADRQRELRTLESALDAKLREVPFDGGAEALALLSVPTPERVARLIEEGGELRARERDLSEESGALVRKVAECKARLQSLTAAEELPSVRELETARSARDRATDALGAAWGSGAPFASHPWEDALSLAQRADAVADRLRREADRVAAHGQAEAERAALGAEADRVAEERRDVAEARRRHAATVKALSAPFGLDATTPEELQGFLARRADALSLFASARHAAEERARLEEARERLERAVIEALGALPHGTLAFAVERVAELELEERRLRHERTEIERTIDALSARAEQEAEAVRAAEAARVAWRDAWTHALQALGVTTPIEPAAALGLLEELAALSERSERIESLEQRVSGIRRDAARLASEVAEPAALLGLCVEEGAPDAAAEEVVRRFHAAVTAKEERARLELELREREGELSVQKERLSAALRSLDELARLARVVDPNELSAVEGKSARARDLRQRLEDIEVTLMEASGGRSVAALVAETEHETAPRLQARLDELERELSEADDERARALDEVASLSAGLSRLAAADGADALQEEQSLAAAVRERVERYARLKLAGVLLERAVERYRLTHQGPVLKRAGELFARLTGVYEGLRVGRDQEMIVAVAPDGRELLPRELSEGTRYQLYLSLRLASIERHQTASEPLPLILDDAIIHFDEARKSRAFSVLSELATTTQILFFTHLENDVTLAKAALFRDGTVAPGAFFHVLRKAAGDGTGRTEGQGPKQGGAAAAASRRSI